MRAADVILIAGPTASGKSRLACQIAAALAGTIVNADAMQVYRELRVITARPLPEDEAAAPHALYGHVAAATRYSVGEWLRDVAPVLEAARRDQRPLIVAGGSGLYFKALAEGLAEVPAIPGKVGAAVRAAMQAEGPAAMHARLAEADPDGAAAIRPSDPARIVRALEVVEATGRTLGEWQKDNSTPPLLRGDAIRIVLSPDPVLVHERISARAEAMVEGGLGEARALLAQGLDPELPAMKAIGVRELGGHLAGDMSLDEAVAAIKTETRRYAKRQMTWFRGQMGDWRWISDPASLDLAALAP